LLESSQFYRLAAKHTQLVASTTLMPAANYKRKSKDKSSKSAQEFAVIGDDSLFRMTLTVNPLNDGRAQIINWTDWRLNEKNRHKLSVESPKYRVFYHEAQVGQSPNCQRFVRTLSRRAELPCLS
jgi:hypothetical protein